MKPEPQGPRTRPGRAVVTGAASGIGRATALELARRGMDIDIVDIDEVGAEQTRVAAARCDVSARVFVTDLANDAAVVETARAIEAVGPVDLLVNNAGVAVVAPFEETTAADWDWAFAVNVRGPITLTRALVGGMRARNQGHIAFVASLAGLVSPPGMLAYSTTKFALVGFAEGLRLELAASNVGVTLVCPGYVRTSLHANTRYRRALLEQLLERAPRWYGLSSEDVATELANAVARGGGNLVLGPEKVSWWAKRLAPDLWFRASALAARLVSRHARQPSADAAGTAASSVPKSQVSSSCTPP